MVSIWFFRQKKRDRVHSYPAGLLDPVHRKNAWQIGGQIGKPDPYGRQYLMGSSEWDSDALQDELKGIIVGTL